MKHSTLLKRAKKHLCMHSSSNINSFVCNALDDAVQTYEQHKTMLEIRKLISSRLYPCTTIYGWLSSQLKLSDLAMATDEELQDYRLRWMDSLIQEYKEAGK